MGGCLTRYYHVPCPADGQKRKRPIEILHYVSTHVNLAIKSPWSPGLGGGQAQLVKVGEILVLCDETVDACRGQ